MHVLEKEMATHSSILAWRIPGMEEPGGLPSMGLHRVRHDWSDLAAAATSNSQKFCFLFQMHWALLVWGSYFQRVMFAWRHTAIAHCNGKWDTQFWHIGFLIPLNQQKEPTEPTPWGEWLIFIIIRIIILISSRYHLEPHTRADRENCL